MNDIVKYLIVILFGYFIGNISFAKILSKSIKDDITKHGSGNPGSMNMLRSFGLKMGMLTLILDSLKGALATLLGYFLFGASANGIVAVTAAFVGGASAVVGHCYPVIYKFKGGKGVATMFGAFCVISPLWAAIVFVFGLVFLIVVDYGALMSFLVLAILIVVNIIKTNADLAIMFILLGTYAIVLVMHKKNIVRLVTGKENKVGFKSKLFKTKNKSAESCAVEVVSVEINKTIQENNNKDEDTQKVDVEIENNQEQSN